MIDASIIDVPEDGLWQQTKTRKTPEESLNEYLVNLRKELDDSFTPDTLSKPKRVFVLVVGDYPTDPEKIVDNAKAIQEVSFMMNFFFSIQKLINEWKFYRNIFDQACRSGAIHFFYRQLGCLAFSLTFFF